MSQYEAAIDALPLDAPDITPQWGDTVRIDTEYSSYMGTVERYCEATDRVTVRFWDVVLRQRRTLTFDGWRISIILKAEAAALAAAS